jgi:GNAT superfamily N-acetyltransferase
MPYSANQALEDAGTAGRSERTPAEASPVERELAPDVRIEYGLVSDHAPVLKFLTQTLGVDVAQQSAARLDDPSYRPADRLLVRRRGALIGHVHVARHTAWFENQRIALARLEDFAVSPEHRGTVVERSLLAAAEEMARREGAVAAIVASEAPEGFLACGWSPLRGQGHTRADASGVLAYLDGQRVLARRRRSLPLIRAWRHFELQRVAETYERAAAASWGALCRTEDAWRWLAGGTSQDQLLLAVGKPGSTRRGESESLEPIYGYAVVRLSCIVEVMAPVARPLVRALLLVRACRDAIDRGCHGVTLYAPASDPLHELLVTAGGAWVSDAATAGPRRLIRLLNCEKWVERMDPVWRRRAREASIGKPLAFRFRSPGEVGCFRLTRRSSHWEAEEATAGEACDVVCDLAVRDALLLGNLSLRRAVAEGRLAFACEADAAAASRVFAPRFFWQSPWDLLRG